MSTKDQPEYTKDFTGCLVDNKGNRRWFINGAYGREGDLPALENADGSLHWYIENPKRGGFGQRASVEHREGGPAIIRENGDRFWMQFGKLHREGGPAVELADGTRKWAEKGNITRVEIPKPEGTE